MRAFPSTCAAFLFSLSLATFSPTPSPWPPLHRICSTVTPAPPSSPLPTCVSPATDSSLTETAAASPVPTSVHARAGLPVGVPCSGPPPPCALSLQLQLRLDLATSGPCSLPGLASTWASSLPPCDAATWSAASLHSVHRRPRLPHRHGAFPTSPILDNPSCSTLAPCSTASPSPRTAAHGRPGLSPSTQIRLPHAPELFTTPDATPSASPSALDLPPRGYSTPSPPPARLPQHRRGTVPPPSSPVFHRSSVPSATSAPFLLLRITPTTERAHHHATTPVTPPVA